MNELFISVEFPEEPTSPPVETGEHNDVLVLRCITIIIIMKSVELLIYFYSNY